MKPKKSARIKGTIMRGFTNQEPFMCLPIDNPDALVEQVAMDIAKRNGHAFIFEDNRDDARAALRSIGVPLKK